MATLSETIDRMTQPAQLFETLADNVVRCSACANRCTIAPGKHGICRVRFNREGVLYAPSGYVAGLNPDPIEKKPFFHFLPGSIALTFGMVGCNLHCDFCQNWQTTQPLRDSSIPFSAYNLQRISAQQMVAFAQQSGARVIASSYNEPLITGEWAAEIFTLARQASLHTGFISNGYATPQALDFLRPVLDGYKIDLKSMQESNYQAMGGSLSHVLDTIQYAKQIGLWVEVVTLVIPGFNDSVTELWEISRFLASVSVDIPWHVTAYHPDYKMNAPCTPVTTLQRAAEIGQEAGLRYVYAGNLPGRVGSLEDTFCPQCQARLIQRQGFWVVENKIGPSGTCPKCQAAISGIWT